MDDCEFTLGGRLYRVIAPFDGGTALSAAKRVRVTAAWLDGGAAADDPTRADDWFRLSDVLACVERANDDGSLERMASGELLHADLTIRDAAALFERAAHHVAIAELQSLPTEQCGAA
ncbi:MAG: hypothetical protein WBO09_02755 [Methylocystis silviterrae]|uniref:hypothetical protein n=1 Tax=Methylocystis silviterrae TaxID=2743612 RepID=UPI003C772D99